MHLRNTLSNSVLKLLLTAFVRPGDTQDPIADLWRLPSTWIFPITQAAIYVLEGIPPQDFG